jgi:hypothetical protein
LRLADSSADRTWPVAILRRDGRQQRGKTPRPGGASPAPTRGSWASRRSGGREHRGVEVIRRVEGTWGRREKGHSTIIVAAALSRFIPSVARDWRYGRAGQAPPLQGDRGFEKIGVSSARLSRTPGFCRCHGVSKGRFFRGGALRDGWRCGCRLPAWRRRRWRSSRSWNGRWR